jgi:hypothetical protein
MKWTEEEYARFLNQKNKPAPEIPKPSKYHSVMTELAGIKFQSKKEARVFQDLQARRHMGEIKFILTQVPFRLLAGYVHRLDFMVVRTDGGIEYIEAKGRDLPMGKMKRKMVEEQYGIHITIY